MLPGAEPAGAVRGYGEMADTPDLGSGAERRGSSSLSTRTIPVLPLVRANCNLPLRQRHGRDHSLLR